MTFSDHRIYDQSPGRIFNLILFEDGKMHTSLGAYLDEIDQDFNREQDITKAMRDIIHDYTRASARVDNKIEAALARGEEFIKIANEVRQEHFGATHPLVMKFDGHQIHTGVEQTSDTADHTAG